MKQLLYTSNASFVITLFMLILVSFPLLAQNQQEKKDDLMIAVEQLRHATGKWSVRTEFLNEDGSVARSAQGSYSFVWVVPDRVLSGQSEMPEMKQRSGILFYVNEKKKTIEMVSVGGDGRLWIMTGVVGDEVRTTQPYKTTDGKETQLRFTRYNVKPDSFESKMEYTQDGGKSWLPGNHQVFTKQSEP